MAYVQKVSASADNVASISPGLTGVTAGNTLALIVGQTSNAVGAAARPAPTDSSGQTWSTAVAPVSVGASGSEVSQAAIYYLLNANAGTHNLTYNLAGAGQFCGYTLVEFPACSAIDVTASNSGTTSVTTGDTGTTGATAQANEAVLVCLTTNTIGAGLANAAFTDPPGGYTSLFAQQATNAHTGAQHSYLETSATGTQSATWTWTSGAQTSWMAVIATFRLTAAGATPTVTSTSTASPSHLGSLTITGTNFEAAQGTGGVTIGGVAQTVTAWSDTSITVTVDRGVSKYGAAVNIVVTNNSALSSSPYALTSILPQSGWSYVDIGTPNTTASLRITCYPDLASGDQVAYASLGGSVSVISDGTFSVTSDVRSFDFEVWSSPDGWGGSATQYVRVDLVDIRLRRIRQRSAAARWMWAGYTNEKLTQRGWFSRDIVLPVAASGGAAALQASVASAVTVTAALSTQVRLVASASGQVTVAAALTTQIPLAAASAAVITASAALTTQIRLAATPAGQATVTAALTTGVPLAALAQSVVTVTAALASNAAALQSTVQGQTTLTAALSTGIPLAAAAQGVTTVTAALAGTAAPLQASAQAQSTVAADLTTQIRLQATVANVATLGAQLSTGIQLATAASSSCTVTAALTTAIRLQATVQAVITASATLAGTAAALQASVQSQATVSAALTVAKPLACVVIAQAQVSATLTTRIALQAIAQAQTTATAALTTQQSYEAAVLCSVTLSAAFQVHPGARASAPGVQLARSGGQSLRRPAVVALRRK